jgi:hypothetical protein
MDNARFAAARHELLVGRYPHLDVYRGTREELIGAGLIRVGMFPGDPGRNKIAQTYRLPHRVCVTRRSRSKFDVHIEVDAHEYARRIEAEQRDQAARAAAAEAQRKRETLPVHADDYRRHMRRCASVLASGLERSLLEDGAGFRFDDASRDRIEEALYDLRAALEEGRIVFDRQERAQRLLAIQGEHAKADAVLQAFLATARAAL